jgi:hypothetical protein
MLCYADTYVDHTITNSYIILTETGSIVVRYDCYFVEVENRQSSQLWWRVHRPPNGH